MSDSRAKYFGDMALGAILSAGHVLSSGLIRVIESESFRVPRDVNPMSKPDVRRAVRAILGAAGFAAREDAESFADMLPPVYFEHNYSGPRAGHGVRLLGNWFGAEAGTIMTLSGARGYGVKGYTIGKGSHYWSGDDSGNVSLSAGGPSSILALNRDALRRTDETAPREFWRFRSTPQAHTGVYYSRVMPLWEWQPNESDWLRGGEES